MPVKNSLNNQSTGFTVNAPASGTALTVNGVNSITNYSLTTTASVSAAIHNAAKFENTNTTAGSSCQVSIDTQNQSGASGGDPSLRFLNTSIRAIALGIDSSTDQFVMANSSALGTSNILTWTASNNQINLPLQCAFHAYIGTAQNDKTGDNTAYDVIFQTERYDVSGSYNNATGVFTAPATGKYIFNSQLIIEGLTAGMTSGVYGFLVNGFSYYGGVSYCNPYACALSGSFFSIQNTAIFNLTAGDTVVCRITVNGGAKVCDFSAQTANYFAGQLLS